jgi:hypothetical protein
MYAFYHTYLSKSGYIGGGGHKKKTDGSKACKCPTCSKDTEVEGGDASSLLRNWLAM